MCSLKWNSGRSNCSGIRSDKIFKRVPVHILDLNEYKMQAKPHSQFIDNSIFNSIKSSSFEHRFRVAFFFFVIDKIVSAYSYKQLKSVHRRHAFPVSNAKTKWKKTIIDLYLNSQTHIVHHACTLHALMLRVAAWMGQKKQKKQNKNPRDMVNRNWYSRCVHFTL